jgi:hypothetical protein
MCCWESTACSRYNIVINADCFALSALHFDDLSIAQPGRVRQRDGRLVFLLHGCAESMHCRRVAGSFKGTLRSNLG